MVDHDLIIILKVNWNVSGVELLSWWSTRFINTVVTVENSQKPSDGSGGFVISAEGLHINSDEERKSGRGSKVGGVKSRALCCYISRGETALQ